MHRVKQLLRKQSLTVAEPHDSVAVVVRKLADSAVGAAIVLDEEDRLLGIFSERDLMLRVIARDRDPKCTTVQDVMTRDVITASLEESRDHCIEKMRRVGCRHLPVLAGGEIVGMLSMRDLLYDEIAEQEGELENLRAYLHQRPL